VHRLHRLLTELIPGGAGKDLSATKAKRLLATVRLRSLVGKTTRRMVVEEVADLVAADAKLKALTKELATAVQERGSHLMKLPGIGPAGAARIPADAGDIERFPDLKHFASWTGTAPLDASSGSRSGTGSVGVGCHHGALDVHAPTDVGVGAGGDIRAPETGLDRSVQMRRESRRDAV